VSKAERRVSTEKKKRSVVSHAALPAAERSKAELGEAQRTGDARKTGAPSPHPPCVATEVPAEAKCRS